MFNKYILLSIISFSGNSFANDISTQGERDGSSNVSASGRKPKANIVSFEPAGENIDLGFDFLVPFIQVPIVREVDVNGKEPALININSAALISTGFLVASSVLVSYIFKTYVIIGREEDKSSNKNRRSDNNLENEFLSLLNNFKLVYKNSSGIRVDTSLSGLFDTIDETFLSNDIDLSSCIRKAICKRIQISSSRVFEGNSSGVDKIIDGLTSSTWLKNLLGNTSLKDVIEARDISSFPTHNHNEEEPIIYCNVKYPKCKWSMPQDNLVNIIRTYMKFT